MYSMLKQDDKNFIITKNEREILRDLASKYSEIAVTDRQKDIKKRYKDINGLRPTRPVILIEELPWHELNVDDQLTNLCQSQFAIEMETFFRRALLQDKYFPCDRYFVDHFPLDRIYNIDEGFIVKENILAVDDRNNIVAHEYLNQLEDESDLEKFTTPVVESFPDINAARLSVASEILEGILPVRLYGVQMVHSPWDEIPRLHGGVTNTFLDLIDRPDFMHSIIKKMTANAHIIMDQLETLGLLDAEIITIHCTPALSDELPAKDYDGGSYRLKDVWFRSMAQMFSDVSPELTEEFDINYVKSLYERCALGYYGCCESLDNKFEALSKIPNLRKIGVSSWANVRHCAEHIGDNYVFSRKPNPANVAQKADPDIIRAELLETIDACRDNNCVWDYVLKDISTAGYDINNLVIWEKTVKETLDKYFS